MLPRQGGGMFGCPTSMRRMWQNFRLRWFVHSFVATEQRGVSLFHKRFEYKSYFVVLDWKTKCIVFCVCCVRSVCVYVFLNTVLVFVFCVVIAHFMLPVS